jgi:hypothetical protein
MWLLLPSCISSAISDLSVVGGPFIRGLWSRGGRIGTVKKGERRWGTGVVPRGRGFAWPFYFLVPN